MPSYKKHILFSIIMAFPFFPDVFYLSLAVLGASIIDMDHDVNKKNLTIMALVGLIITLTLYILKLPFLIGIILIALALVFYISKHRGFMHSFMGIIFIACFLSIFILGSHIILQDFKIGLKVSLIIISLILGFMIVNKKLMPVYSFLIIVGIILTPSLVLNPYYVFGALFLGCLSHIILDLFTPSGVELLNPLFSKKYRKGWGRFLFGIWVVSMLAVVFVYKLGIGSLLL